MASTAPGKMFVDYDGRKMLATEAAAAIALQHQKDKNSDQRIAKQNALLEGKSGFSPEERAAFKGRRSRVAGDMREIGRAAAEKTAQSFHDTYAPKMDEGIRGLQKLDVDEEMSPTPPAQAPEPAPAPAPAPTPERRSDQLDTFFAMRGDKARFSPEGDPFVYEFDPSTKVYTVIAGPSGRGAKFGPDHPAIDKFRASMDQARQEAGEVAPSPEPAEEPLDMPREAIAARARQRLSSSIDSPANIDSPLMPRAFELDYKGEVLRPTELGSEGAVGLSTVEAMLEEATSPREARRIIDRALAAIEDRPRDEGRMTEANQKLAKRLRAMRKERVGEIKGQS